MDRSDFEFIEMDTDSAYFAISADNIDKLIKPQFEELYQSQLKNNCTDNDVGVLWFPRRCCDKHRIYDKRTPGLFKLEFEGNEMIGLCSKTYAISNTHIVKCTQTRSREIQLSKKVVKKYMYRGLKTKKRLRFRFALKKKPFSVGKLSRSLKFSSKGISKQSLKTTLHFIDQF